METLMLLRFCKKRRRWILANIWHHNNTVVDRSMAKKKRKNKKYCFAIAQVPDCWLKSLAIPQGMSHFKILSLLVSVSRFNEAAPV
jgi:hypothetical protein